MNKRKDTWMEAYSLAKNFYEEYGHLSIPKYFTTFDGIKREEGGFELGKWLQKQLRLSGKDIPNGLSHKKIILLENIDVKWDRLLKKMYNWNYMYNLADNFYNHFYHLDIPVGFKTKNGYTEDQKGEDLGKWLLSIKKFHAEKILSEEKIQAMEDLNINWSLKISKNEIYKTRGTWKQNYDLVVNFFNQFGHSDIPVDFKTNDGINYDKDGLPIGLWLQKQRKDYDNFLINKGDKKYQSLKAVKIVWYPNDNQKRLEKICSKCNIDNNIVSCLSRLPTRELKAKILFLKNNNLPIIEKYTVSPIFFMSDKNLEAVYGVTLEEIINQYLQTKKKA